MRTLAHYVEQQRGNGSQLGQALLPNERVHLEECIMFEVDLRGFLELEGGKPALRLAVELVANAFDEARGYVPDRKKPSYSAVSLAHQNNPRGVLLTVADDGPGFLNEADVYTLYGSTPKRGVVTVGGRFNLGEKQVIAVARWARVRTNAVTVEFADGKREVTRHRAEHVPGTIIEALMPWSLKDMAEVREGLGRVLPPEGLNYMVDGVRVERPPTKCQVQVTLPTVKLIDGVMRPTTAKTAVSVLKTQQPTLFELGIPVCDLSELGFPWSLDVQQKVPVPPSRDAVSTTYQFRLIGSVLEAAAMDGISLLTQDDQGAPFIRAALEYFRDPNALRATIESAFGPNPIRPSADPRWNHAAEEAGMTVLPKKALGPHSRRTLEESGAIPTVKEEFCPPPMPQSTVHVKLHCPHCGGELN